MNEPSVTPRRDTNPTATSSTARPAKRHARTVLVLAVALSGLLAIGMSADHAWAERAQEARDLNLLQQPSLPMLQEVVITATRLEA